MPQILIRWTPILAAFALAFVQLQCLLIPDDTEKGERVANQPPRVRITAGASTSDPSGIDYKVLFRWNGIDDDGVVAGFEWAVDDTISETAWRDTTGFSALVKFKSTTQTPGDPNSELFTDWHTFFIRAVDNELAVSEPDIRFFNTKTIAPTSRITFPILTSTAPELQRTLILEWDGEDIDSSRPDQKPVAWEFKLARIPESFIPVQQMLDSLRVGDNLLLDTLRVGSKKAWVRVPLAQTSLKLEDLPANQHLTFAVRAIDEAGAVEPSIERGRNMIAFGVRPDPGQLRVTMVEPTGGRHVFPSEGETWEISIPTNRELRFRWAGDASHYGSLPGKVNYALDIPDVEDDTLRDPDGVGGWIGWGTWAETNAPIVFGDEDGGTHHHLWVKMRDISDDEASEIITHVDIFVVPFTFENFALIVDDSKFAIRPPTDAQHDAFLRETITRRFYDLGPVDHLALYPPRGIVDERSNAIDVELATFARYQHIFWSIQVGPGNPQPLRVLEAEDGKLSSYASAGGRLFFGGGRISSFMLGGPNGTFRYPKGAPLQGEPDVSFEDDSFIWRFMRYHNTIVSVPTGGSAVQVQASGLIALRSQHPAYPDLKVDAVKRDPFAVADNRFFGGIRDWEGVQGLIRPLERMEGLDSLYTAVTMDTTFCCGDRSGGFNDAVVGQRYQSTAVDTLNGTQQGRTMIFNFQPYWFEAQSLTDAGTAAINWLVTGRDHH